MELRSKETKEQIPKNESGRVELPTRLFAKMDNTGKGDKPENLRPQIGYLGDISKRDKAELNEARESVMRAADFIKNHAETPVERKTAEELSEYIKAGKVVLCDTKEIMGKRYAGVFGRIDEKTREPIIGIDIKGIKDKGAAELVDTLFHESYHAAQHKAGHNNDEIKEETKAWNLGLEMSNKYRGEHGEKISKTKPYTETDLLFMGYPASDGRSFTEIC